MLVLVLVLGINVGVSVSVIGPLQVSIDVVQNRHIGTQTSHWDKTNKGNYHLELCVPFVGLTPMRLLRANMPVLFLVDGNLQRANC